MIQLSHSYVYNKEIIKIRVEIKESIVKVYKTKSWFFEKTKEPNIGTWFFVNKTDKTLDRLIKKKGEKTQINKLETKMERSQQTTQKYKGS